MSGYGRRGQPIVVLAALLIGWAGARAMSWNGLSEPGPVVPVARAGVAAVVPPEVPGGGGAYDPPGLQSHPGEVAGFAPQAPAVSPVVVRYVGLDRYVAGEPGLRTGSPARERSGTLAHLLAEFAGTAPGLGRRLERLLPAAFHPLDAAPAPGRFATPGVAPDTWRGDRRRWSADAWMLLRRQSELVPGAGTLPATYGGSQSGGVLRYRLSMDPHRPTAYLRATTTLGGFSETAGALGISARPFAGVPLVAAAEGRLTWTASGQRLQPAVFAVTELPPLALPGRLRAEVYAQGGYVGGQFATPFADGQARIDAPVLRVGRIDARVGAGLWGGMQKGASRLDAGPSAMAIMPLGRNGFGRIAVDWRQRIGGNASPGSGPALSLSAGF